LVMALLYTGMGFPPVVVGLFVYLMLSRSGPAGSLGWLFTPKAMVVAQTIISFPLVAGFTMAAVMGVDPHLRQQVQALGATEWQITLAILAEARIGVVVSVIAGFGSIISEVGAVMLVGGNIEGKTRVLTTAIVLETRKGNFDLAMALGIVLLSLSFMANLAMLRLQGQDFLRR
jgi:tungstate transport system permease protein